MSDNGKYGKIVQVIGPVIDVEFPAEEGLPEIYIALTIDEGEGDNHVKLTAEVQQHLGRDQVHCSRPARDWKTTFAEKRVALGAMSTPGVGMLE